MRRSLKKKNTIVGKAQPIRTVRRQSRIGELSGATQIRQTRMFLHELQIAALFPTSFCAHNSNQRLLLFITPAVQILNQR